jgi:alkylhydroperoxidase/carboxymuconolactone decarboxylase family protein YurZ
MDYIEHSKYPLDPKTKQLQYIASFAAIGYVPAIKPYLPHALRSGATKEEILSAYLTSVPVGGLVNVLPALKEVSQTVDDLIASTRF